MAGLSSYERIFCLNVTDNTGVMTEFSAALVVPDYSEKFFRKKIETYSFLYQSSMFVLAFFRNRGDATAPNTATAILCSDWQTTCCTVTRASLEKAYLHFA